MRIIVHLPPGTVPLQHALRGYCAEQWPDARTEVHVTSYPGTAIRALRTVTPCCWLAYSIRNDFEVENAIRTYIKMHGGL